MDTTRIAGIAGAAALLGWAMTVGPGALPWFIDVPSALTVLLGGYCAWLAMVGRDRKALVEVLRAGHPAAADLDRAEEVALARRRAYWALGLLGTLVGLIQLFNGLDDPSAWGPALAVFFLQPIYAALADLFIASPMLSRVREKRAAATAAPALAAEHTRQLDAAMDALGKVRERPRETVR